MIHPKKEMHDRHLPVLNCVMQLTKAKYRQQAS
jgi:hypothetical protein